MSFNIAIDGPAGAGKSTIARKVAGEMGFLYVDTGAMYRTIALGLKRMGVDSSDEASLEKALPEIEVTLAYEDGAQQVFLNGENVSSLIRTEEIGALTSKAATKPQVRQKLKSLQQELAASRDVIMDGRDIGSVILPNAQLKIFLTASVEERARRRVGEMAEKGIVCDLAEIMKDIAARDEQDMHRAEAPLIQTEDAVYLDTSDMSIDEVVAKIRSLAEERMGKI